MCNLKKIYNFISKIQIVFKNNCLVHLSFIEEKLKKANLHF